MRRSACTARRLPSGRRPLAVAYAIAALLLAALPAAGQLQTVPRFDFSFSNPGARSLGFAGAFAALADDATAAYANPAGLVQLTEEEVSLELRLWSRSPSYLAGGRFEGAPTGNGLDTTNNIITGRDRSEDFGPSFVSVVVPRGRWSFAIYGHQLAQFELAGESQGFFFLDPGGGPDRSPGTREQVDLDITSLGAAAGLRLSDRWSVGLGIVLSDISVATSSAVYEPDEGSAFFGGIDGAEIPFGPVSFLPDRLLATTTMEAEGTDVTVNAGLLYRVSDRLSAALLYRQGARADGRLRTELGPVFPVDDSFTGSARFSVPELVGAGLAYRSSSSLTRAKCCRCPGFPSPIALVKNRRRTMGSSILPKMVFVPCDTVKSLFWVRSS